MTVRELCPAAFSISLIEILVNGFSLLPSISFSPVFHQQKPPCQTSQMGKMRDAGLRARHAQHQLQRAVQQHKLPGGQRDRQ